MRDDHGNIEFCHVYIEGNAIADYLAHVALETVPVRNTLPGATNWRVPQPFVVGFA